MFFSFEEGLQALEGALAIGRQADPLGLDAVKIRFEAAQGQATRMTSVPDSHLFFKAKGWFGDQDDVGSRQSPILQSQRLVRECVRGDWLTGAQLSRRAGRGCRALSSNQLG